MTKFFLKLYHFFAAHKAVFYIVLISTTLVFGHFACQIHFEENILALLPQTDKSKECSVAFGNIKVKDKVFVEITTDDGKPAADSLAVMMDRFLEMLQGKDDKGYIDNVLYRVDTDDIMNVVYYAMGALPCHLGEEFYDACDSILAGKPCTDLPLPDLQAGSYAMVDGHLLSSDSTTVVAYLAPGYDILDTKKGNAFEVLISGCVREFQKENPGYTVLYHGTGIQGTFNSRQIKKDLIITVGISLILACLLFGIAFKKKRTLLYLLAPVLYGIIFALAMVYWIQGEMSFIAIGIGAVILGVALSYVLHVVVHRKFRDDVETVLREETRPVCLGCLTTIGAFAALLFTSSALLRDFGIFASFELIGTTFFALAFLPQFMNGKVDSEKNDKVFAGIDRFNNLQPDRCKPLVIALSAICIASIFLAKKVGFDSDLNNIGYLEPKMVRSENLYNQKINRNQHNVYYAAHADDLESAIVYSRTLDEVLDSLRKAGTIYGYSGTQGILVPQSEQEENIARWKEYWTPSKVEKAYSILREQADSNDWAGATGFDIPGTFMLMAQSDYYPQDLYYAGIIPDGLLSTFAECNQDGWLVFSSANMEREMQGEVNDAVATREHLLVLDPFYYTGDMVEIIHDDFNTVLLISSLFVLLILLISYRSLIISLIAFLPMFFSWEIVQAFMFVAGLQFNLINIMISTFIFGIGVDYSIFVMDGLIADEKKMADNLLESHKAAIVFSGVTLIIVVGSLLFATHPAIYSVGISTIVGMVSTILITYTLQPLLFRLVMKNGTLRKKALHLK